MLGVLILAAVVSAVAASDASLSQSSSGGPATTIPSFPLGESAVSLRGPARAGMYISAVGRRAIAMGAEDGPLEIWSWPIKWLHDLELSFRIPKYATAVPGRAVAHAVVERPEGITIEYAHEQFTVREHVFVPLDEPAVVILLEVDAIRPLDVIVRFAPDIHYAWPAGLGGQYLVWNQDARAFLFSESRRGVNAFLGSPAVTEASDVPAHMLAADRPQFVLGVGGATERYTAPRLGEPPGRNIDVHAAYIPIVLAGGQMPREDALALYRRLTAPGAAEAEWNRRVDHASSIRETLLAVQSPDRLLDRAVEYAKVNLDEAVACNPDLGCGLVAGYGRSGAASDRPGFGWFFGGDAAINSFAMTGVGQTALVRDAVLRFFATRQRADGKIPHEISQGAGHVDWFSYPYAYYHGDTTPFWMLAVGEYWRQTGDTTLVRELWPNIERAFEWSRATDTDGDGLMENPAAGAGALEVGDLQIGILSDVYLSGVWAAALDRFARMADAIGQPGRADEARAIRARALATMEAKLWTEDLGQYAFALLQDGSVNPALTAWPAAAMAFDAFEPTRGARMAAHLASSSIMTDWGARPLESGNALFDPLHYNNGAVWPFVTGFVALAQYRYHNAPAGWFALQSIARTGFDQALGRNPEVISGRLYKPLDTSVPQQFFATSMVLTPLVRGLLGLDVDVPARRVTVAPHLPPDWNAVRVDRIPVGDGQLALVIQRSSGRITATVTRAGDATPIEVVFSPALPIGARVSGNGATVDITPGDVHATVSATVGGKAELSVSYAGGWSIVPPVMPARIGRRSEAARVLSERQGADGRYEVALEGIAGRSYTFELIAPDARTADSLAVETSVGRAELSPHVSDSPTRPVVVTFPPDDTNADGYSTTTLRVRGSR